MQAGVPAHHIWVVDNSADKQMADEFEDLFPRVQLLNDHGNVGYAAAVNYGARLAKAAGLETLLVLTHEVRFPSTTIAALLAHLERSPASTAVAPRIRDLHDSTIAWSEGGDLRPFRCLPVNRREWRGSEADWVDGCIFMLPLRLFWSLGGMHEPYFLYMEEVDFFARLRAEGGTVHVLENSFAQQAPGGMPYYLAVRNRIILARRVASRASYIAVVLECCARIAFAQAFQRRQIEKNRIRRKALRDAFGVYEASAPDQYGGG